MDIVARDGETTVFVEVKTRENRNFGDGAEAVTGIKRRRIVQLATDYLVRHRLFERPCRFDVVSITLGSDPPEIVIYEHAFSADQQ